MSDKPWTPRSAALVTLVVALGLFGLVRPASSAESLAAVAPADTALFLEIPALDATWTAFDDSELAERWKLTRLSALWLRSPFVEHWRKLDLYSTAKTGQTLTHHLRKLFADGVAIAVVLRDQKPTGVLVARAASPDDVTAAIRAWDKLEPPLRTESRTHAGRTYHVRVVKKSGGEQSIFYATDETQFVLSDQERLVRDCLQLWSRVDARRGAATPSLADQPEFQELLREAPPAAMLYLAPHRWQPVLSQLRDGSPASDLLFAGIGKLRGVMTVVTLDGGLLAELTATLDPAAFSTDWRDFVATAATSPTIIEAAPADALLVAGGRFDVEPFIAGFTRLMPEHDRRELNKVGTVLRTLLLDADPWTVTLPALLSDWGGYVALRPTDEQQPPRSHPFVALISAQRPASAREAGLSLGLENALSFGVNALATALTVEKDGLPITLQRLREGDGQEWRLSGRAWGEFALRLTTDAVRWSSSVEELRRMKDREPGAPPSPLATTANSHFPKSAAFLWVNSRLFRASDSAPALQALAGGKEPPPLAALNELGKLFDELFAAVQIQETRIGVRAGGRIAGQP
ncbi:MAG: hypothetical protein SH850_06880 [Planctomycetaceae bacterium]|nr:hypothetical protein [Planctomycetaceae bacterium]